MATVHITRAQYRAFAELTKKHAGMALNLSTFAQMGCWGSYSPWALLTLVDATDPETKFEEVALITIANAINVDKVRAVGPRRPELDWSKLEDHEIYPFLVWHEIGHRLDNFDNWGVMTLKDLPVRDECHRLIGFVNEVLADRYAWSQIRPGQAIPMSDAARAAGDRTELALEYLNAHAPRIGTRIRFLEPGRYKYVPESMLATPKRAAFVGTNVSRALMAGCLERQKRLN